jgi:hypothetical protein
VNGDSGGISLIEGVALALLTAVIAAMSLSSEAATGSFWLHP